MQTTTTTTRTRRFAPLVAVAAIAAFMVAPATGEAFRFGAKLTPQVQPSNAGDGHDCRPNPGYCSWVMNEAYGRPNGGHKSKYRGVIRKIRLIANVPGSFRLQIVKVGPKGYGKVIRNGRKISYQGQSDPNAIDYEIETFKVKMPVKKGHRLAIKASNTSLLRCSSGGPNTLFWQPPLKLGAGFSHYDDDDGCWLLLEAIAKKR